MSCKAISIVLLLLLISLRGRIGAQDLSYTLSNDSLVNYHASQKKSYFATRTALKPKIDGKLDDECWQVLGVWEGNFIQQQPHQAKAPSQPTKFKILYDDNYLYVAVVAYDNEPDKMSRLLGQRDDYSVGDLIGFAIDSYNDKQTAFEFSLTSAGQKVDILHKGEYDWDLNWNAVWDGKTSIGDSAWYAEMRIPFAQIRFSNKKEHVWGMNIWRYIYRLSEESHWKLVPIDAPAMVYIFGDLRGIKDIPNKRNIEIMPYASTKYVPSSTNKFQYGFGVDGKVGISSDFTLDYTFNPDFGQVEADPSELNLTSYETFYEEKRPFFLEGNNVLDYKTGKDMLFYSRRIGHAPSHTPQYSEDDGESILIPDKTTIINALKLTGKNKKGLSVGVVNSITAKEYATIRSSTKKDRKQAVEPFTNYTIARVKQDFNKGSTVLGGIVTSAIRKIKDENLNFLTDNSFVGGLDFEHNWNNRKYFMAGKSFASSINGSKESIARLQRSSRHYFQREGASHLSYNPEQTNLRGWGGELEGGKRSGRFRIKGKLAWRSPGVDLNDLGYMRQADYIKQRAEVEYIVNKPKGILLSYSVKLGKGHDWSYGGENLRDDFDFYLRFRFKNNWKLGIFGDCIFSEIDTRELRGGPSLRIGGKNTLRLGLQTNPQKDLFFALKTDFERGNDRITQQNAYTFHVNWRISNRFLLSSHSVQSKTIDNNQYIKRKTVNDKQEYLVGKLNRKTFYTTLRAEFFVTPELSLQYYGSPYVSTGNYLDYRKVASSKSKDLTKRFAPLVQNENLLIDNSGNLYHNFNDYGFDFNFQEFRSNFVLRWEYKTGSTAYFVWTNNRSSYKEIYEKSILNSFKDLRKVGSKNAFMIKLSYWFGL